MHGHSDKDLQLMGLAVELSGLNGGGGNFGSADWSAVVPVNIDELPEVQDVLQHVRDKAMAVYDAKMPVSLQERMQYRSGAMVTLAAAASSTSKEEGTVAEETRTNRVCCPRP